MTAFERVKGNAIYTPSELAKRTEAPPLTGRELTDYSDDPEFAILPAEYLIAATSTLAGRFPETQAASKTDALSRARDMSAEAAGVSFGVYAVRCDGAVLVASFFNGERKFEATQ